MNFPARQPVPAQYPDWLCPVEAEAILLGALMIDNRWVDRVADIVAADDFYEPVHQRIYAAILGEVSLGRTASPVVLRPLLASDPALNELGGVSYLAQLTGNTAALIAAGDCAKQISDFAKRRRLLDDMRAKTAEIEAGAEQTVEQIVEGIDNAMVAALRREEVAKTLSVEKAFDITMAEIEAEAAGDVPAGLTIAGFDDWNQLTGTMRRGEVIILAGRPSMGKTAVALSTALGAARAGLGTLFVSLEMSVKELMKRAITDLIFDIGQSASFDAVKRGDFTAFDRERLASTRQMITSWPFLIRQDAGLRLSRLAMLIRRTKRTFAAKGQALDIVFIDYLGLVKTDQRAQKRYEEVSEVSRAIKQLARELDVAIVLLAQLNREVEKREDKRPMLSDLRDSGEIEQDADTVIFVYREEYYLERSEPDQGDKKRADWELAMQGARDRIELISAKVRNGKIGKRLCYFFAAHQAVRGSRFYCYGGDR